MLAIAEEHTREVSRRPRGPIVVDRCWNVLAGNRAMPVLMDGIPSSVLEPHPNVYRLALHPDGLASRLVNFGELRNLFLERLLRQVHATGDPELRALFEEVSRYPGPAGEESSEPGGPGSSPIRVPLRIRTPQGELSMFSTMATFGAPADVTLSELAIELFYPLDEAMASALRAMAQLPELGRHIDR